MNQPVSIEDVREALRLLAERDDVAAIEESLSWVVTQFRAEKDSGAD